MSCFVRIVMLFREHELQCMKVGIILIRKNPAILHPRDARVWVAIPVKQQVASRASSVEAHALLQGSAYS